MSLLVRLNAVLIVACAVVGVIADRLCAAQIRANARRQVLGTATLMLDSALASREYTAKQIDPLLVGRMQKTFLPQSIPFYAATQTIAALRELHPNFTYKEATLDPFDPSDLASNWQADIIGQFRNHPALKALEGERTTPLGRSLFLARPIRAAPGCLDCHGSPNVAPASLIKRYGRHNGFGWQPNEVMAAEIVSVPFAEADQAAKHLYGVVTAGIVGALVVLLAAINVSVYWLILRPLRRMTHQIDEVSLGQLTEETFTVRGGGELAALGAAFARMCKSLDKALKMIGGGSDGA
jgi:HAMP domain-containing protein